MTKYDIEKIVIHPKFKPNDYVFGCDIAIVKTKKQIQFTPTVQPICLPTEEDLEIGLISQ